MKEVCQCDKAICVNAKRGRIVTTKEGNQWTEYTKIEKCEGLNSNQSGQPAKPSPR